VWIWGRAGGRDPGGGVAKSAYRRNGPKLGDAAAGAGSESARTHPLGRPVRLLLADETDKFASNAPFFESNVMETYFIVGWHRGYNARWREERAGTVPEDVQRGRAARAARRINWELLPREVLDQARVQQLGITEAAEELEARIARIIDEEFAR
jgi:hypothetical protein